MSELMSRQRSHLSSVHKLTMTWLLRSAMSSDTSTFVRMAGKSMVDESHVAAAVQMAWYVGNVWSDEYAGCVVVYIRTGNHCH